MEQEAAPAVVRPKPMAFQVRNATMSRMGATGIA
jgi:hypothetical protein